MNIQFTITIAGQDHPQLVNQLAAITHSYGGKWLISKISRLEHQLVGIIKIEIPDNEVVQLKEELRHFSALDVRIIDSKAVEHPSFVKVRFTIESKDRLGIVRDITGQLDEMGIEILQMENHRLAVPEVGEMMFFAELTLNLPTEISFNQLEESLLLVDDNLRIDGLA